MRSAVEFSARLMSAFGTLADISTALTFSPLVAKADIDPMAPNVRFGFKADIALASLSLRPFWHKAGIGRKPTNVCFWLDSSRHRSGPALGLGVSQPKFRTQNCSRKNMGRVGMSAARPVILTGVNEAQDVIAL